MGSPFRRIDPDSRAVITKDENDNVVYTYDSAGDLISFPVNMAGGAAIGVADVSSREILDQILGQLKIMNLHLSILTNEEITNVD
jgi:hypothetical protein